MKKMKKTLLLIFLSLNLQVYSQLMKYIDKTSITDKKELNSLISNIYTKDFSNLSSDINLTFNSSVLPNCATLVSPIDNATNVALNYQDLFPFPTTKILYATLNFLITENNPSITGVKFNFGTNSSSFGSSATLPPNFSNIFVGAYYNTTYYWQIIPTGLLGDATGCPIFSFTTGPSPGFCFNGSLSPTETLTPSVCDGVTLNTISYSGPLGHYANVNVIAGQTYKFASDVATDIITISDFSGNSVFNYGTTPVTWTATNSEVIRFYTHINNNCNDATTSSTRTRTIICGGSLTTNNFELFKLKSYPNPVKDILNLTFDKNFSNVSIYNSLGQEVISKSINNTESKIDMSKLAFGVYVVKVTSENEVKTLKVIKE